MPMDDESLHKEQPLSEVWHNTREQLRTEDVRTLAHMIYRNLFQRIPGIPDSVGIKLYNWSVAENVKLEHGILGLPAEQIVSVIAEEFHLPVELLKQWIDRASREMAQEYIDKWPEFVRENENNLWPKKFPWDRARELMDVIVEKGISAPGEDHEKLVRLEEAMRPKDWGDPWTVGYDDDQD